MAQPYVERLNAGRILIFWNELNINRYDSALASVNGELKDHKKHVEEKKTPCTTCHDSHGVTDTKHLINFNTTYVSPSSGGRLEFIDGGVNKGTCYLTCHGEDHTPKSYGTGDSAKNR